MLPLFDLMMKAQDGKAMQAMADQFNLAQEQAARAVAALMPAFSAGLKRQSSNPFDFASLMSRAATGNYASYFEDFARAFTPQGIADGNAALGQIFGSKEVSRAIAAQAEQMTGIGQEVLKRMMPVMADTMLGGIVKQMTGQLNSGATPNPFTPDGMATISRQWMETMGMKPREPEPQATIFDNPFTQAMQGFFANAQGKGSAAAADPFSLNPFVKSFQEMMAAATPAPAAEKPAPQAKAESAGDVYSTFVNQMFDSGLEVQKSYQASLDAIFDQWTKKGS